MKVAAATKTKSQGVFSTRLRLKLKLNSQIQNTGFHPRMILTFFPDWETQESIWQQAIELKSTNHFLTMDYYITSNTYSCFYLPNALAALDRL